MSLFRASDPAADADWSVPTPRGPYPVTPSYPDPSSDPDAPTQRLYRPIDEPEPLSEPDDANPYELLPQTRRPHRSRGVLLRLVLLVDYLEHGRTFPNRRANAGPDQSYLDFRSSSGRCAHTRHQAENHPQVLIIAPWTFPRESRPLTTGTVCPQWESRQYG